MSTAITSNDFLTDFLTYLQTQCITAMGNLTGEAVFLVWIFGIITIGIHSITDGHLFGSGMVQNYIVVLIKVGVFLFMVGNWQEISIDVIFKSFELAGQVASNYETAISPSNIFMTGFTMTKNVMAAVFKTTDWYMVLGNLPLLLLQLNVCLVIIAACGYMAIMFLLVNIEFYIFAGLSIILVPFGMVPQLRFLFDNVISGLFNFGVKYMTMVFVIGLGHTFLFSAATLEATSSIDVLLKSAVGVIVFTFLVIRVPDLVSGMIYGAPSRDSGLGMLGNAASSVARKTMGS